MNDQSKSMSLEKQRQKLQPEPQGSVLETWSDAEIVEAYLDAQRDDREVLNAAMDYIVEDDDVSRMLIYAALGGTGLEEDELEVVARMTIHALFPSALKWAQKAEANGELTWG
jgi:hypothetical protein